MADFGRGREATSADEVAGLLIQLRRPPMRQHLLPKFRSARAFFINHCPDQIAETSFTPNVAIRQFHRVLRRARI